MDKLALLSIRLCSLCLSRMRYSPVRSAQARGVLRIKKKRKHIRTGARHNIRYRGFELYHVLYRRWLADWQYFLYCHAAYITLTVSIVYGQSAPPVEIPAKDIQKHQEIRSSFGVQCGSAGSIVPGTRHTTLISFFVYGIRRRNSGRLLHCGVLPSYRKRKAQFSAYSRGIQRNADNDGFLSALCHLHSMR